MVKIIAISATQRDKSNTEAMLLECIKTIEKEGTKVELIKLRKLDFKPCDGCEGCDDAERCHIEDSMQRIYPKLLEAKIWIIASPEYWWNVSGLCKNFIDRLNAYWKIRKQKFGGKKVVIITCGGQPVERNFYAEKYLKHLFTNLYFEIIGSVRASADEKEVVLKQKDVMEKCKKLGKMVAKEIK